MSVKDCWSAYLMSLLKLVGDPVQMLTIKVDCKKSSAISILATNHSRSAMNNGSAASSAFGGALGRSRLHPRRACSKLLSTLTRTLTSLPSADNADRVSDRAAVLTVRIPAMTAGEVMSVGLATSSANLPPNWSQDL